VKYCIYKARIEHIISFYKF